MERKPTPASVRLEDFDSLPEVAGIFASRSCNGIGIVLLHVTTAESGMILRATFDELPERGECHLPMRYFAFDNQALASLPQIGDFDRWADLHLYMLPGPLVTQQPPLSTSAETGSATSQGVEPIVWIDASLDLPDAGMEVLVCFERNDCEERDTCLATFDDSLDGHPWSVDGACTHFGTVMYWAEKPVGPLRSDEQPC